MSRRPIQTEPCPWMECCGDRQTVCLRGVTMPRGNKAQPRRWYLTDDTIICLPFLPCSAQVRRCVSRLSCLQSWSAPSLVSLRSLLQRPPTTSTRICLSSHLALILLRAPNLWPAPVTAGFLTHRPRQALPTNPGCVPRHQAT